MVNIAVSWAALLFWVPVRGQEWHEGGNAAPTVPTHFVGWSGDHNLNFRTDNQQRMRLNRTLPYTVNGMAVNGAGYLGLCPNNALWNLGGGGTGPFSRLHLHDGSSGPLQGPFRDWMQNGVTFTTNLDQMYVGHRVEPGTDQTSAVFEWGDNEFAPGGPDVMKFIFSSTYTGAASGQSSLGGREIARLHPSGYLGIGDWQANSIQPTERVDLLNGRLRIRDLPGNLEAPELTRVLVVDDSPTPSNERGVVKWRYASSLGISNACVTPNLVTKSIDLNGSLGCSQIWDNGTPTGVGIATQTPTELLDVNGNITANGFVNAENNLLGFKLGATKVTVLAHGSDGTNGALGVGFGTGLAGSDNVFAGDMAASGAGSLSSENTVVGFSAGSSLGETQRNTLIGAHAGELLTSSTTSGSSTNTMVGAYAGAASKEGDYNVFVGQKAGLINEVGSMNVVVGGEYYLPWGPGSGPTSASLDNTGTFGFATYVSTCHTQRFGNGWIRRWGFGLDPDDVNKVIRVNLNPGQPAPGQTGYCPDGLTAGQCSEAFMDLGGNWNGCSDRNAKTSISELDDLQVLKKLTEMPIVSWSYKNDEGVKHIGPMAQDFYAAYGLGHGETVISTIDPAGVALASIKGLNGIVEKQEALITALTDQLHRTEQRLEVLERTQFQQEMAIEHCCSAHAAATKDSDGNATPGSGADLRISPNPFGDRTTITYVVNCDCRVRLEVTTADGKPLRTLLDAQREQGQYSYEWNTDSIAAGAYYCTLLVDGKPTVKQAVKVTR